MSRLLRLVQRLGNKRPYFHIYGADGSLYMGRWWIFGGSARDLGPDRPSDQPRQWKPGWLDAWIGKRCALRLHLIAREDRGRDLHTHPASFVSLVLAGEYIERRPWRQDQHAGLDAECYYDTLRRPFSLAFRRASDRHTITSVSPGGCWTLVLWGRKRGSWGFWTREGFVNWRNYQGAA